MTSTPHGVSQIILLCLFDNWFKYIRIMNSDTIRISCHYFAYILLETSPQCPETLQFRTCDVMTWQHWRVVSQRNKRQHLIYYGIHSQTKSKVFDHRWHKSDHMQLKSGKFWSLDLININPAIISYLMSRTILYKRLNSKRSALWE